MMFPIGNRQSLNCLEARPVKIDETVLEVGSFVRKRRKANKMTQRDLAELAGVGTRFVSELERGKASVRLDAVNAVLAVFGRQIGLVALERGTDE
jgi:y4mF family transcriptional regulator